MTAPMTPASGPDGEDVDAALELALGLRLVSIRLHAQTVDDFKLLAAADGVKYQAMMRAVLDEYVSERMRAIARERLTRTKR